MAIVKVSKIEDNYCLALHMLPSAICARTNRKASVFK